MYIRETLLCMYVCMYVCEYDVTQMLIFDCLLRIYAARSSETIS